jgi:pyruvate dehydrogenase phosphatase
MMGMGKNALHSIHWQLIIPSGWEMSRALQAILPHAVFQALEIIHSSANAVEDSKPVDESIKKAFTNTDNSILDAAARAVMSPTVLTDTMSKLGTAYAGSCALLFIYDSKTELLRVVCTGDSRAVLGRKNSDGTWTATPLSIDQTGFNLDEVARLEAEHPNERGIIQNGRIATLAVTRAFGDCALKWSQAFQFQLRAGYFGRTVPERFSTMPYLTAEPDITTTKIRPGGGDFVVMASDGLWDNMTSDQAVELVGTWLQAQDSKRKLGSHPKIGERTGKEVSKAGGGIGWDWKLSRHDYVTQDNNAATHLIRNSLGGANSARVAGLLTPVAPMASEVRDDITVQVIFF